MKFGKIAAVAFLGVLPLAGCAPQPTVYGSNQQMQVQAIEYGTVQSMRMVETRHMQQGNQVAGALIGGVLGALAGKEIGKGRGNTIATGLSVPWLALPRVAQRRRR